MESISAQESSYRPFSKGMIAALIAVLGLCVVPATVAADEAPDDEEQGLINLRTANDAFDEEDFDEAYQYYVKAYEILEIPEIKYRMGQTAQKTDRVERAVQYYEEYREEGEDEEFLSRIEEELPILRAQLPATLEVVTDPEGARVVVADLQDETDEEFGQSPAVVEHAPGDIEVRLELEDYETETFEKHLEPGADELLEATLAPVDDEEPVAEEDDEEPVAEEPEAVAMDPDVDDDAGISVWGWTSTGLGASILALGGVMSIFQYQTTQEVNEFERRGDEGEMPGDWEQRRADQEALRNDAESYHQAATGAYIAGGVLTAAGLGVLAFDAFSGDDDEAAEAGLRLQTGIQSDGGFIGIDGRF